MSEHNINIGRNGKNVFLTVTTDLASEKEMHFCHECSCETEAELLTNYLRDRHNKKIKAIRKAEFFSGWKHAKAKKHGKKWFSWFYSNINKGASHE